VIHSYELKFNQKSEINLEITAVIWLTPGLKYVVLGLGR